MSDIEENSFSGSCCSSDELVDENHNRLDDDSYDAMLRKLPKTSTGRKNKYKHQQSYKKSLEDCGHSGKENPLVDELDVFYNNRVRPRQSKKKRHRRIAYSVVWKVLLHSSNLDEWFDVGDIVRNGENYEGIVTNDASKVEFWVPLHLGTDLTVYIHKAEEDGYVRVQPESQSPWKDSLNDDDFLQATDARVKLQTSVDTALCSYMEDVESGVESLPDEVFSIDLVILGSSILLRVNESFFVDLIPVIKIPDCCKEWCRRLSKSEPPSHAVAKPCVKPMSDPETLWQLSFAQVEERMIEDMTDAQFQLLLTFFELREKDSFLMELSWYHFQTIIFHLLDVYNEPSFWANKQIGARFVDVLQRLEFYLGDKYLPHFYMPSVNLLAHLNNITILKIKDRVKRLARPTCSACGYLAILDPVLLTCLR